MGTKDTIKKAKQAARRASRNAFAETEKQLIITFYSRVLKPCPKYFPKKVWIKLRAIFINVPEKPNGTR